MQHGERSSHPHLFRFHRLLEMDEFSIQSYCATYPTKSIVDAISISIAPVLLAQTPTKLFCYHLKKSARSPKFSTFTHFITALSARKTKDSKIIFGPQDSTKKGGTNYNRSETASTHERMTKGWEIRAGLDWYHLVGNRNAILKVVFSEGLKNSILPWFRLWKEKRNGIWIWWASSGWCLTDYLSKKRLGKTKPSNLNALVEGEDWKVSMQINCATFVSKHENHIPILHPSTIWGSY